MTGTLLGKRYELLEKIDSGGMADIFKARCRKTNSLVAIKILKEKFSGNSDYIERFKKEAGAVFSLDHPNIVDVTDIGNEDGVYYMVMEFIEGTTLKKLINRRVQISEKDAVKYSIQICSALSCAHAAGIIHRDIKPQNILIDNGGNVKLTDFGIAESLNGERERSKQVIGSVYYISPEQAKGEPLDESTDIYSLGIVMYEMLTGQLPHTGKTVSVALKHINEQIIPPKEIRGGISNAVNNIILKATSKEKADRYKSADAFKDDLMLALTDPEGSFVDLPPEIINAGTKAARKMRMNALLKAGVLVLLAGAAVVLAVLGFRLLNPSAGGALPVPDLVGLDINAAQARASAFNVTATYQPSETVPEGTVISQSPEPGSRAAGGAAVNLVVSDGPEDLIMPDFTGMPVEDAKALIITMGLTIDDSDISYEPSSDVSAGRVISQMPEAGDAVSKSDSVTLVVAEDAAQNTAPLPDCSGKPLSDAVPLIFGSGFSNCFVYGEESKQKEGTVIFQSPAAGEMAKLSDEIDLHISRYADEKYQYKLRRVLNITENKTSIVIVVQEYVGQYPVSFVVKEIKDVNAGNCLINETIKRPSGGQKTVIIYVNNIETFSAEVNFDG